MSGLLFWALVAWVWCWVVAPIGSMARYGYRLARRQPPGRWSWWWPAGPGLMALLFWLGGRGG